jgi:HEAT repeat protein
LTPRELILMRLLLIAGLSLPLAGCGEKPPLVVHGKPVSHWVEAMQDPDPQARIKAARMLGNAGAADSAVVPALIKGLKDPEAEVRGEVILALLKIGPDAREAIPALREARQDEDDRVQSYAEKALQRIQGDR